jgi:hypothetical protein
MVSTAAIFSTLGNPNSLVPLAVKDVAATTGMTTGSLITGKEEGKDRFIDEVGTSCIWLLGIPSLKWLYNNTVFKALGLDAKFDPRNLNDKDVLKKIKEYAPDENVKNSIDKIEKNEKLFKNTAFSRFIFSTALTIVAYVMLTKFKQKYTEKQIKQNLINEYNQQKAEKEKAMAENKSENVDEISQNPSFRGMGSAVEYFVFSPVKNMLILEGAITTTRLKDSRSPQELIGYAIKESFAWIFLYFAGARIQKAIENNAKAKYNKSISLDARVLEGGELKKAFEDGSIEKSLEEFKAANTSNVNLYEFLHKNPDNMIVKTAKKSDIIKLYKDTGKIDTREYIDLKEVEGVSNKISELYGQYKMALKKGETSEKFFAGVKKLKRKSVLANIGACILALGIISPGIMVAKRFISHDDTEFQTKKDIREQLVQEGVIA